jgi:hypothetical protein
MPAPNSYVDLGSPVSWPTELRSELDKVARILARRPAVQPREVPACDLQLGSPNCESALEATVRRALTGHLTLGCHATRLLPPEVEATRADGLQPLSMDLRRSKLALAAGVSGPAIGLRGRASIECWLRSAAAEATVDRCADVRRAGRRRGSASLELGGESIAWAALPSGDLVRDRLSAASQPAALEVAVPVSAILEGSGIWWIPIGVH